MTRGAMGTAANADQSPETSRKLPTHVHPVDYGINVPRYVSIYHLLEAQAERIPEAPAILAPKRAPLTYGQLFHYVNDTVQTLQAMGLASQDRVALVLPNGPEAAVAFLAVAAAVACSPLNPSYRAHEFETYFAELHPTVLIVSAELDSSARSVAYAHGIRVLEL